jgi:hypothetical protein
MNLKLLLVLPLCFLFTALGADESQSGVPSGGGGDGFIEPAQRPDPPKASVNWSDLFRQSTWFLAIEHSFRLATEHGTRSARGPLLKGYLDSVRNLHGWSDGDSTMVNYVGHPIQGAVAGYIWVQNDLDYRSARFGQNRRYWKSRLRAAGFAWAYSTQFEIGPVSEASIGYIQSRYPAQGFVDHVLTPTLGLGWMVAEDVVDRYILASLERRVQNPYVRIFARGFLNPGRTMANVLRGKGPWHREGRAILGDYTKGYTPTDSDPKQNQPFELPPDIGPAPFELSAVSKRQTFLGADAPGICVGGGAEAAFRLSRQWQFLLDVNGCKLSGLPVNTTGDTLTYLVGPRWTPSERRLRPYMQFLVGGAKIATEVVSPEAQKAVEAAAERSGLKPSREEYITRETAHGFAVAAGTGVDLKLGRAAAVKLASLEYTRSWIRPLEGIDSNAGLQLKLGVTLRMGTW